jgi:hypothetical protein
VRRLSSPNSHTIRSQPEGQRAGTLLTNTFPAVMTYAHPSNLISGSFVRSFVRRPRVGFEAVRPLEQQSRRSSCDIPSVPSPSSYVFAHPKQLIPIVSSSFILPFEIFFRLLSMFVDDRMPGPGWTLLTNIVPPYPSPTLEALLSLLSVVAGPRDTVEL